MEVMRRAVGALRGCRVLVVDMTHGGVALSEELLRRDCEVTCLDVHRTLSNEDVERLKLQGLRVAKREDEVLDVGEFDVIAVQHAPRSLKLFSKALEEGVPVITHARAVGIILSEEKRDVKVVEVTGTNGKTTTVSMVAKAALDYGLRVLVHDSLSTKFMSEGGVELLASGLSITPANVLKAWRISEERGLRPDMCVFEVSLGGTGAADVGVVTGILENYPVSYMVNAFNSKLQMALNMDGRGVLVLNGDDHYTRRFLHVFRGTSNVYGFEGGVQVRGEVLSRGLKSGLSVRGVIDGLRGVSGGVLSCEFSFNLKPQLFGKYQALNALAALTTLLSLGFDVEHACSSISSFEGVDGRSKAQFREWGVLVDCVNRGVNVPAIVHAIKEAVNVKLEGEAKRVLAVIGGSERATCELVDSVKLAKELKAISEVDKYFLSEALGLRLRELGLEGVAAPSIEHAEKLAEEEAERGAPSIVVVCYNGG
ncbi:MAG: coenzyme F430 synthase [Thermoprotei archaeon]|nr:MAG: coenzyme F430 synthase [Thermoprotei archaeon]